MFGSNVKMDPEEIEDFLRKIDYAFKLPTRCSKDEVNRKYS